MQVSLLRLSLKTPHRRRGSRMSSTGRILDETAVEAKRPKRCAGYSCSWRFRHCVNFSHALRPMSDPPRRSGQLCARHARVQSRRHGLRRLHDQAQRQILSSGIGNFNQPQQAIVGDDILDRRRHDPLTGSKVLGCLGRRDETRRIVHCERQNSRVPTSKIARQFNVGDLPLPR